MTPVPSTTSLPGTSLLAFARLWFSPAIVAGAFEPLVADWQGEARASDSPFWINLRWRLSFLTNCWLAAPRLLAAQAPPSLLFDVVIRAVVFGALGFVLQQTFGRRGDIEGMAVIDSLPFALLPVVMRLQRSTELPAYAARALALRWSAATAIALALFSGPSWHARSAAAAIPMVITLFGWRLAANSRRWTNYNPLFKWWLTVAMLATTWMLAAYPIKLAVGIPLLGRFWGTDVQYLLAIVLSTLIQVDDWRERRRRV
ncbi:MAG: hypothetical protein Q8O42_05960 [Acidobacteriota bacterium]|nr:hypothetical protein [Acidobacteriota bacterium]